MKERSEILCKDFEILFHFNFRSNRVIQLDQAGKNKETADKVTGKLIDEKETELKANGESFEKAYLGAAEEYAIECAMLKVYV